MDILKNGNEYNAVMAEVLNEIKFGEPNKDAKYIEILIDLSRRILEPEWRRVKKEAGGDKN